MKLTDMSDWPQFVSQVRLMLDSAFPFVGTWMRAIASLDHPPNNEWLANTALICETTMEMIWIFLREVWWILRMRVAGRGHDIILHIAETHTSAGERDLRVPRAWYQLERESGGRTLDRRFEMSRKAAHPEKVREWSQVPTAIRAWDRALTLWQHVSGQVMDETTKMQTLTSILPDDLRTRVTSQLRPDMTYDLMREYVISQVALEETQAAGRRGGGAAEPGLHCRGRLRELRRP